MEEYLKANQIFWNKGYYAPNPESWVFRTYGRILKYELKLDKSQNKKVLDFGCGQGANSMFFKNNGFDVYGIDISEIDINIAKKSIPDISEHFKIINPQPEKNQIFFGGNFKLIIGIQSLYYLSDKDLDILLKCLYYNLENNGIIYATMMGSNSMFYEDSTPYKNGLRKIETKSKRKKEKKKGVNFVNFTKSEEDLIKKFHMFKPLHIGFYDFKIRSDEGNDFHYSFIGQKI